MKKLNILDYKKVGDKMACAFADECELIEVAKDDHPLRFKYVDKKGDYIYIWTTLDGRYHTDDPKSIIYPRAGVYTWDNEPKLVNYDNLEVLSIISESETIVIAIGDSKEGIFYDFVLGKIHIHDSCKWEVIPEHLQTQSMKELRNKVIYRLKN